MLKLAIVAGLLVALPVAAQLPDNWDGLVKVRSPRADAVYLAPGAEFQAYTKVMLDETEVAFRQNFLRDYNRSARGAGRITDAEATEIVNAVRTGFEGIFAEEYRRAGYEVVTQPGSDVLRLRTAVVNLYVTAPEQMMAGRVRSYSYDAGQATLILEARDSISGALLGRAVDSRIAGDNLPARRTRVSNQADFEQLFRTWARASVAGLATLKAQPPVPAPGS
jgi:hypothetical protein